MQETTYLTEELASEMVRIEQFLPDLRGCEGRPQKTRAAIARSFSEICFSKPDPENSFFLR